MVDQESGGKLYSYNVVDPETKEVFYTRIKSGYTNVISDTIVKNYIRVDLKPGSLEYGASYYASEYLRELVEWSTGIKLSLKDDFLGTTDLVSKDFVGFSSLATGKVGKVPVTFYIRSVPGYITGTTTIDPKKGHLAYGIVDSSVYPDGLLR